MPRDGAVVEAAHLTPERLHPEQGEYEDRQEDDEPKVSELADREPHAVEKRLKTRPASYELQHAHDAKRPQRRQPAAAAERELDDRHQNDRGVELVERVLAVLLDAHADDFQDEL
eukprot:31494-Pelagococcus_subviridis.AAC.21